LILRKIFKFVASRCQILRLKCTKFNCGWVPPQSPLGELTGCSTPLLDSRGLLLRGQRWAMGCEREEKGGDAEG